MDGNRRTTGLMGISLKRTSQWVKAGHFVAVALLLGGLATEAYGTTFEPKNFDQLVGEAEQIFVGTVTLTHSRKEATGAIVTDVTFDNLRMVKGAEVGTIRLEVLGGTVGEETLRLSGVPTFQEGERYLVFMAGNGTTVFPIVGGDQGLFQVRQDPATGVEVVGNAYGAPILSPSVQQAVAGGTGIQGTAMRVPSTPIPLDTFLQTITDRLRHP